MILSLRRGLCLAVGLGVGFGLMAGAVVVAFPPQRISDAYVQQRARALGMVSLTELPPVAAPPTGKAPTCVP